jgi:hypothetical protein
MRSHASHLLPALLLALAIAASARGDELTYELTVVAPPARVRLVVEDEAGVLVVVRQVLDANGTAPLPVHGRGRRDGDRLLVTFDAPSSPGLAGSLQAAQTPRPGALEAEYTIGGGRIRGRLVLPDGRVIEEEGAAIPLPPSAYASLPSAGHDGDAAIDLAAENAAVSARLRTLSAAERGARWPVVICPGLAEDDQEEALHPRAAVRLRLAVDAMREVGAQAIIVSGGNVHPDGTPHNEAMEMKRALIAMGVPADRIAIDPSARHTTTNLRNAARFLFAHGLERALVVTTPGQSFYLGHGLISTFQLRCKRTLGYTLGRLFPVGLQRTDFVPSRRCLERGDDPLDR